MLETLEKLTTVDKMQEITRKKSKKDKIKEKLENGEIPVDQYMKLSPMLLFPID